jgi:hypothetical protein
MRNFLTLILFISTSILFQACSEREESANKDGISEHTDELAIPCLEEIQGMYIGQFGDYAIRINLTYVNEHKVIGYNLHRGLQRNISGDVQYENGMLTLTLHEPGDHEYDGKFILAANQSDCSLSGKWESNSGKISPKTFQLNKIDTDLDEDAPIALGNFTRHFYILNHDEDELHFRPDGRVTYSYFPEIADTGIEEKISFNGTWSLSNGKVLIEWEKNNLFTAPKLLLNMELNDYTDFPELTYGQTTFYQRP